MLKGEFIDNHPVQIKYGTLIKVGNLFLRFVFLDRS